MCFVSLTFQAVRYHYYHQSSSSSLSSPIYKITDFIGVACTPVVFIVAHRVKNTNWPGANLFTRKIEELNSGLIQLAATTGIEEGAFG